jgi:hypothetical protein
MDQAVVERESEPLWTHLLNLAPQGSRLIDGAGQRLDSEDLGTGIGDLLAIARPMSTLESTGSPQSSLASERSTA